MTTQRRIHAKAQAVALQRQFTVMVIFTSGFGAALATLLLF